jgi:uncharacterized protein (TIGR03086 family)
MEIDATVEMAAGLIRGTKPDQLDDPTPCRDWDVRALTNHLLQVLAALELAGRGDEVPGDLWSRELVGGPDRFAGAASPWADPAAFDRQIVFGGSPMPAALAATMLVSDLVVHGWDLARATRQELHCPPDAAASALGFLEQTAEQGRTMGIYGPARPVPPDTSTLDRAVALSGRDPAWPA